ncbi:hypothetical protein EOL94_04005 [bacterium]|nr:hypothetical protein [bacterium]
MSLISDFGAGKSKNDTQNPKFNDWEKHGYKSLSGKLNSSTLSSSQRKEIDSFFKQEMLGGKTKSNSQIISEIKKRFGPGAALKIKESLTPAPIEGLTDAEKRLNVRLGKQSARLSDKKGNDNNSGGMHFANQSNVKRLSYKPKTSFGGYSNPDQKVTEGVDKKAGMSRSDLFSNLN